MPQSIRMFMPLQGNRGTVRSELVHVTHQDLLPRGDRSGARPETSIEALR